MANKNKFTDEENSKIYFATSRIKNLLFMHTGGAIMQGSINSSASSLTAKLAVGSSIHTHIHNRNWEDLFKNEDWLSFLELAQNVNILLSPDKSISVQLTTIAEHFPKETESYIIVDLLN